MALRLVDEVDSDPELPPVRVGVHSGSAVAHDGDWYGRAVNVASRLCSAAARAAELNRRPTGLVRFRLDHCPLGIRRGTRTARRVAT